MRCPLGVPLPPLYTREAGLQERFPNRLRVGVLIGYNYNSSCTRKIGSIPTPLEASCSFCATNNPDGVRWYSVGPTHPVRASALWASSWVSWGNIPHTTCQPLWTLLSVIARVHVGQNLCKCTRLVLNQFKMMFKRL